jgi:hypothetical protein
MRCHPLRESAGGHDPVTRSCCSPGEDIVVTRCRRGHGRNFSCSRLAVDLVTVAWHHIQLLTVDAIDVRLDWTFVGVSSASSSESGLTCSFSWFSVS